MLIDGRRFMRRLRWSSRLLLRLHSRRLGKIRVVIDAPIHQMSIEENLHPWIQGSRKQYRQVNTLRAALSSPVEAVHCSAYWTVAQTKALHG